MSGYAYDPDDCLVSTLRSLQSYLQDQLRADPRLLDLVDVEMDFPDTSLWTKTSPLERALVHLALDDDPAVVLGFGVPQAQTDQDDETTLLDEPTLHHLNFDVGIWTSGQSGGTTKRTQVRQVLSDVLGRPGGRVALNEATDGLVVTSYGGGTDHLDRVNDLPLYRTSGIELVVSVFGRYRLLPAVGLMVDVEQSERLSIVEENGSLAHVTTDEDPWT